MRKTRVQAVMKGAARLLDIGCTQNRRRVKKTVKGEAFEVIGKANRTVSAVLSANFYSQIKKMPDRKEKQAGEHARLKAIESRTAELQRKIGKYK